MLLQLHKSLSGLEGGVQMFSVRIQTYKNGLKEFQCRNENPPLCVVLSSDAGTERELKVCKALGREVL